MEEQRWEESGRRKEKREDQRRERVRRKKMQVREKVGKSRFTVFFQWFVAPWGRKVGSLKRWVRSHLARWEMKNCTPLWREARFQVKILKNIKNITCSDHARDSAPCQKWENSFVVFPKTMVSMGHLKRIWKDVFHVASAVQRHVHQRC